MKISTKVISHRHYVAFHVADVAIPRTLLAGILLLIAEVLPCRNSLVGLIVICVFSSAEGMSVRLCLA